MGSKVSLNMSIAKIHRLSSHMVGHQLTAGNFISITLSAFQMSAGFVIVGQPVIARSPFVLYPAIIVVGVLLAIVVERLNIGGLSGIRVTSEEKKALEESYSRVVEPTEQQKAAFDRRIKSLKKDIGFGWLLAVLGMSLSTGIGDVFWHSLFEPLGPIGSVVLSLACAAVISLTFIHSELFKGLIDGVLHHILMDLNLVRTAVQVEEQSMQLDMMMDTYQSVRENVEVRKPAEEKMQQVVGRRLMRQAQRFAAAPDVQEVGTVRVVESTLVGGPAAPLALPAPRGKFHMYKDELKRLLANNPNMSQGDIAKHFNVSKDTANKWFNRVRNGE